jgi:hypothetical protein
MCCLDVVGMVVTPSSSHAFGIPVVWNDVVVVRERFAAEGTDLILLDDLAVQEFAHFRG